MPVTVPVVYSSFSRLLADGRLDISMTRCPKRCGDSRPLRLTALLRSRGLYVVTPVTVGQQTVVELVRVECIVPLAQCDGCECLCRVLPADVHARKQYSLPAIEHYAGRYFQGDISLRAAVNTLFGESPAHTTIHGWTEGMGAYALGHPAGEVANATPAQAIRERLAERQLTGTSPAPQPPPALLVLRARSAARASRLASGFVLLALADDVARRTGPAPSGGLAALNVLILGYGLLAPLGWRTGLN